MWSNKHIHYSSMSTDRFVEHRSIEWLQSEIEVWKQQEADMRAQLYTMIERRIADPESVEMIALERMMHGVANCVYQQKVKLEWIEMLE